MGTDNKFNKFLFNKEYKVDRIFLFILLFGIILIPKAFFFSKVTKSDLIEISATVSDYRIKSINHWRGGNIPDRYLDFSLIEYPAWLRIGRFYDESEHKIVDFIDFKKTKIFFHITKGDLNKLKSNSVINPYSMKTDFNKQIINLDSAIFDNDYSVDSMKYISILAIIVGSIYFLTFREA